jgi:hypothetical protein
MKQEIKTQWITALRSGEYNQAQGHLGYQNDDGTTENCCLGVLCDLAVKAGVIEAPEWDEDDHTLYYDNNNEILPKIVQNWAELDSYNPEVPFTGELKISLAELNDGESYAEYPRSFGEIADAIEENL